VTIVATDILADLCGLSLGLLIALIPIGLMLTLYGWWSHRFWIVLATTVLAGVVGLLEATAWQAQPIVVAILLAVAAGVLALAVVRVITFAAGGLVGVYLAHLAFPSWQQPVLCFLIAGLVSLLLFRWFFMALTSFAGAAILAYGTLALMHYHETLDAVAWAGNNATLLSILCGVGTLVGFAFQFTMERRRARRSQQDDDDGGGDVCSMILAKAGFLGKSGRQAA
jgi:hypothetical protein